MNLAASSQNHASPSNKKRVRLCSLRSQKQKQSSQNIPQQKLSSLNKKESCLETPNPRISLKLSKQSHQPQIVQQGRSHFQEIEGIETWNDYDKLLSITSRCIDYYNSFMQEKDVQVKAVKETFTEMHRNLNESFNEIISEAKNKHNELKQFLNTKENQLLQVKYDQQSSLSQNLTSINSIHLENLLKCKTNSADSEIELCNYANTLHRFYETMESVEKVNFKESMEEVIGFAHNVMNEEILGMKPEKVFGRYGNVNASFSFNDVIGNVLNQTLEDNLKKCTSVESTHHLIKQKDRQMIETDTQTYEIDLQSQREQALQFLCDITKQQQNLHDKISTYKGLVSNRTDAR